MYGKEERGAYRALVGKPEGESHLEDIGVNEKVKVKAKFTLEQATKVQRGSRSIALLFL